MRIDGLREIAGGFDGMLIDQFGVIHDGQQLYPHALAVLHALKQHGTPVAVMTNSGKRAKPNVERLLRMGVPRDCFVDAVSSGEVAHERIKGKRPYLIGRRGEDYGIEGAADLKDADIVLVIGSNAPETSLDEYRRFFQGVSIPVICCNPDKLMFTSQGMQPAPGAIAALYEEMGGKVTWIGKPYREIYEHALKLIGNPERCLCIGDSAEHDVAGGKSAGLSTLLVLQGVSAGHAVETLDPKPDYVAEAFRW